MKFTILAAGFFAGSFFLNAPLALAQHDHQAAPAAPAAEAPKPAPAKPAAAPAAAHEHKMQGMQKPAAETSPVIAAYKAINEKMHKDMDFALTGDADVDFVRGMIPHHRAAVEMAKVVAAFGKDPDIRKLASEVIRAQESEITMMQEWLAKNAK